MGKILASRNDGAALAAPQIGRTVRVFVMDCEGVTIEAVNPIIISGNGRVIGREGCLSLAGYSGNVPRYEEIEFEYFDRHGQKCTGKFTGEVARCIQHETDHLDGILFVDRMDEQFIQRNSDKKLVPLSELQT